MPDLLPTTLITRVDGLLATEVDGETVLMHVERGQYYGLARTSHVIWELLAVPLTFEQLCSQLTQRFAGARDVIEADSRRFVQKMAEQALVSLS
jgi:Coenzyme PQQ synthesis protein D (PqqD)